MYKSVMITCLFIYVHTYIHHSIIVFCNRFWRSLKELRKTHNLNLTLSCELDIKYMLYMHTYIANTLLYINLIMTYVTHNVLAMFKVFICVCMCIRYSSI